MTVELLPKARALNAMLQSSAWRPVSLQTLVQVLGDNCTIYNLEARY